MTRWRKSKTRATDRSNNIHGDNTNSKALMVFYGDTEITEERAVSTCNVYNYSKHKLETNYSMG